jgi:hypothetical protein
LDNPFSVLLLHPVITRNIRKTHKSSNLSGLRMVTKLLIRLPRIIYHTNNYLFDEKKENFFSPFFSSSARVIKRMFLTREQKKKLKTVFLFLSDMKSCFMKRLFPRPRSANQATTEAADWGQPIERPITGVSALYDARQAS